MQLPISLPKSIDRLLSTNHSQLFTYSLLKASSTSVTSLFWQKMLALPVYRYVWLFSRDFGVSFIYNKKNKHININPWGTLQFMAPDCKNAFSNETKIVLFVM